MADYRPGTPEQAAFLAELLDHRLLLAGHRGFETVVGIYETTSNTFAEVWASRRKNQTRKSASARKVALWVTSRSV